MVVEFSGPMAGSIKKKKANAEILFFRKPYDNYLVLVNGIVIHGFTLELVL